MINYLLRKLISEDREIVEEIIIKCILFLLDTFIFIIPIIGVAFLVYVITK